MNAKISFRVLLLALCFQMQQTILAQQTDTVPLIDLRALFDNPEVTYARLSPDGKRIAYLKPYSGILNIWVKKVDEPFEAGRMLTKLDREPGGYAWTVDGKYILFASDKKGNENYNIYAVNPEEPIGDEGVPTSRNLTNNDSVAAVLYAVSEANPDILYIGMNDRDRQWHDLYKLEIASGKRTKLFENTSRYTTWYFDWQDSLRLVQRSKEEGGTELLRISGSRQEKIAETGPFETLSPLRFTADNARFYAISNVGDSVNLSKLVLIDPNTGGMETVHAEPLGKVDVEAAKIARYSHKLISVSYNDEKMRPYYLDTSWAADYQYLREEFPGREIEFLDETADETKVMVSVWSDVHPGDVYFFDRKSKQIIHQYVSYPRLKQFEKYLSPMQPIKYKSSDGREIPAYLTLPANGMKKNVPLLVLPHGGPWYRDSWGFNNWVQWLANRGFAVLQVNFRGSTGYGKDFLNAGNLQWGKLMQDDLTWGVRHLIEQGIADPKRIAIFGASYGGYATLAGLTFTPDLYTCGVSYVGPSNLFTLLASIPPYWASFRKEFLLRMGDDSTEEGKELLRAASPLFSADKIKVPLLVIQGANDPRVKQAESDQIVAALHKQGKQVSYLLAPDEGHGFYNPLNSMAAFAATEQFLAAYCGTRFQQKLEADIAKRLKDLTVDVAGVKE